MSISTQHIRFTNTLHKPLQHNHKYTQLNTTINQIQHKNNIQNNHTFSHKHTQLVNQHPLSAHLRIRFTSRGHLGIIVVPPHCPLLLVPPVCTPHSSLKRQWGLLGCLLTHGWWIEGHHTIKSRVSSCFGEVSHRFALDTLKWDWFWLDWFAVTGGVVVY